MSLEINLHNEPLHFKKGISKHFESHSLPHSIAMHTEQSWGVIVCQEIHAEKYHLRHFLFSLNQTLSFFIHDTFKGFQSLFNLKGDFIYKPHDLHQFQIGEKECALFRSVENVEAQVPASKLCSFITVAFAPEFYADFVSLFPQLNSDLLSQNKASLLLKPGIGRYTVYDALQAIWSDHYPETLTKKHIELRLGTALFALLSQTYTPSRYIPISAYERELAFTAKELILKNIRVHLPPADIALQLGCSVSSLQKTFSKVYGIGLFQFLRNTRMLTAKEMLLNGASLKAAALEVGMKPSNFPKEFKAFFGYNVTTLKKGRSN